MSSFLPFQTPIGGAPCQVLKRGILMLATLATVTACGTPEDGSPEAVKAGRNFYT